MSSQGSHSRSSSRESRSPSPKRQGKPNKLFITNLDANGDTRKMEEQLKQLFQKYGQIASCVVKRSHNNDYCFAFIDYKDGQDASEALRKLNGISLGDKSMKVQLQDNSRRRKAKQLFEKKFSGGQCYKCGRPGHFARQCRSSRGDDRRRSRSRSKDRKKKKSSRHRSQSSESRHHKKKEKKKHKSKKSKKSKKKHYSSDSQSSD